MSYFTLGGGYRAAISRKRATTPRSDVRFGQKQTCAAHNRCPLSAKSGHSAIHSITSSARESTDGGTVRPSALAVLRLRTPRLRTGHRSGSNLHGGRPHSCPLWVKSGHAAHNPISAKCQERTLHSDAQCGRGHPSVAPLTPLFFFSLSRRGWCRR